VNTDLVKISLKILEGGKCGGYYEGKELKIKICHNIYVAIMAY
jgi:hypothetical protein